MYIKNIMCLAGIILSFEWFIKTIDPGWISCALLFLLFMKEGDKQ